MKIIYNLKRNKHILRLIKIIYWPYDNYFVDIVEYFRNTKASDLPLIDVEKQQKTCYKTSFLAKLFW